MWRGRRCLSAHATGALSGAHTLKFMLRVFVPSAQGPATCQSSVIVLARLINALAERIADTRERIGNDLERVSESFFARANGKDPDSRDLRALIKRIGSNGELNSKARESLVSLGRLLIFAQQSSLIVPSHEQQQGFSSIGGGVLSFRIDGSHLHGLQT